MNCFFTKYQVLNTSYLRVSIINFVFFNFSGMVKSHKRDHDDGTQNVEDPVKVYLTYVQMALLYLKRSMVILFSIHFIC